MMSKRDVKPVFLWWDLLIIIAILAFGILLMIYQPDLAILGVTIILADILIAPFLRHGYRLQGQTGVFRQEEILVPRECREGIQKYMRGEIPELVVHPNVPGGALVKVYRKGDLHLARYFDYTQHLAEEDFPMVPISQEQVATLRDIQSQK